MHELSVAQNIISIVEEYTKAIEEKKVKAIHLKIGKMSNVLVDSLNFCFESLVIGTGLAEAKLVVEEIPATLYCNNCNKQTDVSEFSFSCVHCSSTNVEMISGNELTISELVVE
jgi:hydrogenase nickel incorporation protein HypA/HybF